MNIRIMIHVYLITSTNSIFKLTNVYFLIKISSLVKFIQPELPNSIIFYVFYLIYSNNKKKCLILKKKFKSKFVSISKISLSLKV